MSNSTENFSEALAILHQLGGASFMLMTGTKRSDLVPAARTDSNPNPWLRIDLKKNDAGVNRMKITLMPSDTYEVEFYHQEGIDPIITKHQVFKMVFCDDLRTLFTSVTGFDTYLPIIRLAQPR